MKSMEKRRKQIRLKDYDYSQPGAYFVTLCTKDRNHLFGGIKGELMQLNRFGRVVQLCWQEIPRHYPQVQLDEFVVMPNHVHGIVVILDDINSVGARHGPAGNDHPIVGATSRRPEIGAVRPRPYLGNVIAYFKYQSAKRINEFRNTPGASIWQRGFFEHIIRGDK